MEASFLRAIPFFLPLAIFPLLSAAALNGGWWIAGPIAFIFANSFDPVFGVEERNIDPNGTPEGQLFWYKLSIWIWAALWPMTLAFTLWQILVPGRLAVWESIVIAVLLAMIAPSVYMISHEFIHRRAAWERRVAEFLLASVSYPLYAIEHVYIHHSRVATPGDPESAPRGVSFWQFFVRGLPKSLVNCWQYECNRMAHGQHPPWHITSVFWRYCFATAAWYALGWWMGGWWGLLIFLILGTAVIFQMRLSDYIQHYGLRRILLPNGRFERVYARHAWSADYRLTNWLFYNAQRHSDHHASASRRFPILQHHGEDTAPQMPGPYATMMALAAFPKHWFATMDPLVDQCRARFYPQIKDWSAYDSPAFAARPEAFEAIAEILAAAPRLACWMNRMPKLLDSLQSSEFTDLDLPQGFGPDSEFERIARRGLVRLYWTRELGPDEMKEQIAEIPTQDAKEAATAAREWSNAKIFQIGVHTVRANLTLSEARAVVSRVAAASISTVLSAVCEDLAERKSPRPGSGLCAVAFGDLAAGTGMLDSELDLLFLYEGEREYYDHLYRRFRKVLSTFTRDNLLIAPASGVETARPVRSFTDFFEHHRDAGSQNELLELARARLVFASDHSDLAARFETMRRDILTHSPLRNALISTLEQASFGAAAPGLESLNDMRGGLLDVERTARVLQLKHAVEVPELFAVETASIFEAAGAGGVIRQEAAECLAGAATLWGNLRAALDLVADKGFVAETASDGVKAVVAQAAGLEDFGSLAGHIREMATRTADAIGEIQDTKK